MSLADFAQRYAPDLAHLVPAFDELGAVICGYSAGPQFPDADDPEPQHIDILIDNPWQEEQWVTIYSVEDCQWWNGEGELYELTLLELLAYLRQLPKPLHSFSRCQ